MSENLELIAPNACLNDNNVEDLINMVNNEALTLQQLDYEAHKAKFNAWLFENFPQDVTSTSKVMYKNRYDEAMQIVITKQIQHNKSNY